MDDSTEADVRTALDNINSTRKARFHLRRALGEPTEYEEINGHLFKPDATDEDELSERECQVIGCEMFYREFAPDHDCPTPLEAYDMQTSDGF